VASALTGVLKLANVVGNWLVDLNSVPSIDCTSSCNGLGKTAIAVVYIEIQMYGETLPLFIMQKG